MVPAVLKKNVTHDNSIGAKTSSYYAGAVYDVSMVMSPFLGGIIDYVGFRGVLCSACALLTIPVFGILAFTEVPPLVATLWLGVTYSIAGKRKRKEGPRYQICAIRSLMI